VYADAALGLRRISFRGVKLHSVRTVGVVLRSRGAGNLGHEALRLPLLALRHGPFQVAGSGNAASHRHFLLPRCGSLYPGVDHHHLSK
jgi:hypothetical protein